MIIWQMLSLILNFRSKLEFDSFHESILLSSKFFFFAFQYNVANCFITFSAHCTHCRQICYCYRYCFFSFFSDKTSYQKKDDVSVQARQIKSQLESKRERWKSFDQLYVCIKSCFNHLRVIIGWIVLLLILINFFIIILTIKRLIPCFTGRGSEAVAGTVAGAGTGGGGGLEEPVPRVLAMPWRWNCP